ncbi:MAG: metallopeptidase [Clostridia bacterium]|nr:VWA-like domain-containing protein [Lachnospiraceae bacterium]NCB99262.1 metallopeptidase [Clostridia bacterium]NCD01411.1 metallopeptidase [Clostridia bacterium]
MNEIREKINRVGIQILSASRNEIYMSMRYFDIALSALDYELNLGTKTIGTDGFKILFNPSWLVNAYREWPQDINRVYVHMIMHNIFRHMSGRMERDEQLWNLACDIAVESMIDRFDAVCVKRIVSDEREAWYYRLGQEMKVLNAQSIYRWFMNHPPSPRELMKAERIFTLDDHSFWQGQEEEEQEDNQRQQQRDDKWKDISQKIKTNLDTFSKSMGQLAGDLVLQMEISLHETYDYRDFLRKFTVINEEIKLDMDSFDYIFYTYGLNAYGNVPLVEPLEYTETEKIRELAIIVDTSESCGDGTLRRFFHETFQILHSMDSFFKHMNLHIIQCDAEVQMDIKIESEEELIDCMKHLTVRGRGGTNFKAGLAYVEKLILEGEFQNLKGVLYFTDGYGEFPGKKPPFDTAFIFVKEDYTDIKVPPWAMKVILEPDDIMTWSDYNEH